MERWAAGSTLNQMSFVDASSLAPLGALSWRFGRRRGGLGCRAGGAGRGAWQATCRSGRTGRGRGRARRRVDAGLLAFRQDLPFALGAAVDRLLLERRQAALVIEDHQHEL